jgi:hypothetical protein
VIGSLEFLCNRRILRNLPLPENNAKPRWREAKKGKEKKRKENERKS